VLHNIMRVNLEGEEYIVASLPKVWRNELGFIGLFKKIKEGILVLTNRKIIFVPEWVYVTPEEREVKYFGEGEAKVTRIDDYSESQLDDDVSKHPNTLIIPLESVIDVDSVKLRKVNFLRIKFKKSGKVKTSDFGISKTLTSYPIRQPLEYYSLDWGAWIKLIRSYL
jgi:hypothetical protein